MSLNKEKELREIAKVVCRDLRKRSTEAEIMFWNVVRNRKYLNRKFYRQHPIFYDVTGKESFFIADFFCFEEKLIIEVDGAIHKYQLTKDEERKTILNLLGLQVIRFTNDEIENNLKQVLEKVKSSFNK
ncbi:MAG: endonuclease domain-containing protein [Ignavibacteriales bacterium]|nr:endonuclease domain-containing protein [Ignavibacteriales bacterium]